MERAKGVLIQVARILASGLILGLAVRNVQLGELLRCLYALGGAAAGGSCPEVVPQYWRYALGGAAAVAYFFSFKVKGGRLSDCLGCLIEAGIFAGAYLGMESSGGGGWTAALRAAGGWAALALLAWPNLGKICLTHFAAAAATGLGLAYGRVDPSVYLIIVKILGSALVFGLTVKTSFWLLVSDTLGGLIEAAVMMWLFKDMPLAGGGGEAMVSLWGEPLLLLLLAWGALSILAWPYTLNIILVHYIGIASLAVLWTQGKVEPQVFLMIEAALVLVAVLLFIVLAARSPNHDAKRQRAEELAAQKAREAKERAAREAAAEEARIKAERALAAQKAREAKERAAREQKAKEYAATLKEYNSLMEAFEAWNDERHKRFNWETIKADSNKVIGYTWEKAK